MSSASGGFAPKPPPGLCLWTPQGDFCPQSSGFVPLRNKFLATPLNRPTESLALSVSEETMNTLALFILIQRQGTTDRQTDRETDGHLCYGNTSVCIALTKA